MTAPGATVRRKPDTTKTTEAGHYEGSRWTPVVSGFSRTFNSRSYLVGFSTMRWTRQFCASPVMISFSLTQCIW